MLSSVNATAQDHTGSLQPSMFMVHKMLGVIAKFESDHLLHRITSPLRLSTNSPADEWFRAKHIRLYVMIMKNKINNKNSGKEGYLNAPGNLELTTLFSLAVHSRWLTCAHTDPYDAASACESFG
jgi:hypothetical protein